MLLTKQKRIVGAVMIAAALGMTYRATGETPSVPAEKRGDDKPSKELEILRQEVEFLKLSMEVVQHKLRVREAELEVVRARATDDVKKRTGAELPLGPPRVAEAELMVLCLQQAEYQRRYLTMLGSNRRVPGSVPQDELFDIRRQCDNYAHQAKVKEAEVAQAWLAQRVRAVEIALKTIQNADDKESRQQATDALEKAVQKLREELKKQDDPKNER